MKANICTLFATVALLAVVGISTASAQDQAKWTGTWKMIPAKSKFAGDGPASIVIKLDLKDNVVTETMTVGTDNGERGFTASYATDGKATTQEVMGRSAQTSAKWEGEALLIDFKTGDGSFNRKMTLSADGKTMTITVRQTGDQGERNETVVLEKQ
ncbi:MAG TPA: hypothetical protein VFZ34_23040 [Blastocatellia bacterium]|nr:hypothetical protein [Blastocatellia bacterium]